jgi:uncharacterized protein (TIGR00255 family)
MRSMTGMGIGRAHRDTTSVRVEIRSVNNRFLDLSFRLPSALTEFEAKLRERVQSGVERGRVTLTIELDRGQPELDVRFNEPFLRAFLQSAREIAKKQGVDEDISMSDLVGLEDAFVVRQAELPPEIAESLLDEAFTQAMAGFAAMREAEGAKLRDDLLRRIDSIESRLEVVRQRAELVPAELRRKLEQRLERSGAGDAVDPQRLAAEVALLVDKATISEEIERMESHLAQFRDTATEGGAGAKRLGFLLQEMHREVNTTGSKSTDLGITDAVMRMKEDIENLREQIQNLE